MKDKLVIIGGGGHAKVLISVIKKANLFDIVGYVDNQDLGDILGLKYLGNDNWLNEKCNNSLKYAALGIGQVNLTEKRYQVINRIKEIGFAFPSIISPDAIINENVRINEGVQVFDGVVINSGSVIEAFSIINTNATIEHDCMIGKYCHIATGATLSGGVDVGDYSMIGSNAVVIQYQKIASNILIGSGSVVIKDILDPGTYVGNPTRKVR